MDKLLGSAPPPLQDKVLGANGMFSDSWNKYISRFPDTFDAIPSRLYAVSLSTQGASISATDFSDGKLLAGLYRATFYARITRAATTSSSLTVTFAWTDGGVGVSYAGTAITGNTTASAGSATTMFKIDKNTAVTYATTYASVGGTAMQYAVDFVLEKIKVA